MDKKQAPWSRREMIERLERQDEFDVTVIGAGATGLGVALDAASRGMSVLIVDGQDWPRPRLSLGQAYRQRHSPPGVPGWLGSRSRRALRATFAFAKCAESCARTELRDSLPQQGRHGAASF